jgi:hypothetical protein
MDFLREVWNAYRPYAIKLLVDLLVSGSFWAVLFLFELLRRFLPITGWGATLIDNLHSAGAVAAFVVFTWLSVADILKVHKASHHD